MAVKPIPEGYHTITPYLMVTDSLKVTEFLKNAFGATETYSMKYPDGSIMHGEYKIGNSPVMLSEAKGEHKAMPCMHYLYVEDVDAVYKKAVGAGGTPVAEPANQFYGDRAGAVRDSSGNTWWIATHVEDVSDAEIRKRGEEQRKKAEQK